MNKKVLRIILSIMVVILCLLVVVILAVNNSRPEKKIEGHWILSEISEKDYSGAYPEKELYFFKDGTYTTNRFQNGTYTIDGNLITIRYLLDAYTYQYNIQKNTLALKWIENDEDDPFIYYEKVKDAGTSTSVSENTTNVMETTTVETNANLLVDDANVFTKSEKEEISTLLESIQNEYSFDIVIHTTNTFNGKSAKNYSDNYFDEKGYGYGVEKDGCIFVINTKQREWYISTHGNGKNLINNERLKNIENSFIPNLQNNQYFDAVIAFLNSAKKFL